MSLSERLDELLRMRAIIRPRQLPRDLLLQRSVDQLNERFERVSPINPADYKALVAKIWEAARSRDVTGGAPWTSRSSARATTSSRRSARI